ncbi:hypothetical protein D046_4717 [Vibrio parahaemolyticus V-223/04]|nr:hypothetical protein D036_0359 [Vibrio parahaemolyticus VP232]EVU14982.1 hypothetical protein D046_4717 [Vibrio parahaemolyticus V-223/04]
MSECEHRMRRKGGGRYLDSEHKKTGAKAPVFVFLIGF